jgi:hypothetical protein
LPRDRFSYDLFSAAYGNIYTPRHLLQLLRRARGTFAPREDRWKVNGTILDPFRPGLRYPAQFDCEFNALTAQHLQQTLRAFAEATVFIFTFGLTEAWYSKPDGAVFPSCPGTVSGLFDRSIHGFIDLSSTDIVQDFLSFAGELRQINKAVRFILTVSPVPLVATGTSDHVLVASSRSKAKLLVAANEIAKTLADTVYFPSYEIITSGGYFEPDRRSVSEEGIRQVMALLLANCETAETAIHQPSKPKGSLSEVIAEAECEEAMLAASRQ